MKLRRETAYLAILALLVLQVLPTASAQLSGNVLYVYDHDPNSSNYYAYIDLGSLSPQQQDGWLNVSADVWLVSYSGSGNVIMLRINMSSTNAFAEFACINGEVYARIAIGSSIVSEKRIGPLDTRRYYPLEIGMYIGKSQGRFYIYAVNFYIAGNLVHSWSSQNTPIPIGLQDIHIYLYFGSPSEPNGGLQYDLYVDNINVNSNIRNITSDSYDFDTKTPSLGGSNNPPNGGYTTTTSPGNPTPIPEPWIAGAIVLAASSAYLLVKRKKA